MRLKLAALIAIAICAGCAAPRPEPPTLVDFTTHASIGVAFDRLDQLSRRCFESAGLQTESAIFRDTGSGQIDLKAQDGSVFLAINLKALSPGQTAVKVTYPATASVEPAWLKSMQSYAERDATSCP